LLNGPLGVGVYSFQGFYGAMHIPSAVRHQYLGWHNEELKNTRAQTQKKIKKAMRSESAIASGRLVGSQ
jgi:hypothetical protein